MSAHAYLPSNEIIDIETFLRLPASQRPTVRCQVCRHVLGVRAEATPQRIPHFTHPPGSGCPTTDKSGVRYQQLHARAVDPAQRVAVVQFVHDHLHLIYHHCRSLAQGLRYRGEFDEMLLTASHKGVWAYRDLPPEFIPAILMVLLPVYPASERRPCPFHFVLDPNLEAFDDLWINAPIRRVLWRIDHDQRRGSTAYDIDGQWLRTDWNPTEHFTQARSRLLSCVH